MEPCTIFRQIPSTIDDISDCGGQAITFFSLST
jgi:hypothetical protein